ncbi:MAG: ferritin-like domain-containing protein [Candidatus Cyclobacteriaceae bacterium M3_2C_046]
MEKKNEIIKALQKAYWKEIETIMNYQANSVNLDGIRAHEIREILEEEVADELGHSRKLAERIKELDGVVEGSSSFHAEQQTSQPPSDTTDLESVVKGVIDAEKDAIQHYKYIIEITDGVDFVTQDLCIELQADEEKHLRLFRGFLKGIEKDKLTPVA